MTLVDHPVWTGAASSVWSTATVASPKNWNLATAGTPTDYVDGDNVVFDDTAGNKTVNISATNVSPGSVTVNTTGTYTITGSSGFGIAGATAVMKTGSGSLTLSGPHTYTGGLTVAQGSVSVAAWELKTDTSGVFGNMNAQTTKQITLGGATTSGTVTYTGGTTTPNDTGVGLNIAAGGGGVNITTSTAVLEIGHSGLDNGGAGTGGIAGSGPFTVTTANNSTRFITVGGSNTFTGPVIISANSQLQANAVASLTETPFGAGTNGQGSTMTMGASSILDVFSPSSTTILIGSLTGPSTATARIEGTGTLNFTLGGDGTNANFAGVLQQTSGTLSITKQGGGVQTLSGANNYSGATAITAGTLNVDGSLLTSRRNFRERPSHAWRQGHGGRCHRRQHRHRDCRRRGRRLAHAHRIDILQRRDRQRFQRQRGSERNILNTGTLTASGGAGSVTINVGGSAPTAATSYKLLGYSGSFSNLSAFTLGTLPNRTSASLTNNTGSSEIDLNVTAVDHPIWSGAATNVWSTAVLTPTKNWVLASSPGTQTDYLEGDNVVFDDTSSVKTVDIATANVSPMSVTVNSTGNYTLQSSGGFGIAGGGSLASTGTGTLTLSSANSFTGGVTIAGGGTIRAATIANSGSASNFGAGTTITFGTGGGTLNYTGNAASTNRAITLTGNATIEATSSGQTLTLAGLISGAGGLTIPAASTGAVTLANTGNTFSGTVTVAGTVNVGTWNNLTAVGVWGQHVVTGVATADLIQMTGGTINYTGSTFASSLRGVNVLSGTDIINVQSATANLDFNAPQTFQLNGGILDKQGPGELQIGDGGVANSTLTGGSRVIIDAGTLDWFGGGSMPSPGARFQFDHN